MVATNHKFLTRKAGDFLEVVERFVEAQGPAHIAYEKDNVLIGDGRQPMFFYTLPMIVPVGTEYVHRLRRWITR